MNPDYVAAEYFLEVLRRNPTFCINYHYINFLLEQAPKEVNSHLNKEGQNDPLHIFKKFPDVFFLSESGINLTDAFLSLYAFPLSAEFKSNKFSCNVFETAAIEYFKLLLIRCGRLHFFKLFSVLLNQKGLWLAEFFLHFSNTDMLKFFIQHSDDFTVSNEVVFLKFYPLMNPKEINPSDHSKAYKKLSQATYFLLSCFSSLHYIEIKQCLAYVLEVVKDYLNSFSLIHQRSIFENLSETTMDSNGSLSLKNPASSHLYPASRKARLISVIVCILAFEMQMHFQKIASEVFRRMSSNVHSILTSLSVSEQFCFFKDFSDYFVISNDGQVTLLPCFVFPTCTFKSLEQIKQDPLAQAIKLQTTGPPAMPVKAYLPISNIPNFNHGGINIHPNANNRSNEGPSMKISDNVTLKICDFSTTYNLQNCSGNLSLVDNQLTQLLAVHTISNRMKLGVIFLCACFHSASPESVFESCLFVLNDVFVSFLELSEATRQAFIQDCCIFFEKVFQAGLPAVPSLECISGSEKVFLFIVYALIKEHKMHSDTLSSWLRYSKVDELNLWFNRSHYFSQLSKYVIISPDGFVSLDKRFEGVRQVFQRYFNVMPENSVPETHEQASKIESIFNNEGLENCSEAADPSNLISPNDVGPIEESAIPSTISKKLQLSLHFMSEVFASLVAVHFLETFLHALSGVKSYFFGLSSSYRQKFIESFFKGINKDSIFEMTLQPSEILNNPLSSREKALLTITYLLIEMKSVHFEKIVQRLESFGINHDLCTMPAKSKFSCFKAWDEYFTICGTGFVCLSSSFTSISSILNSMCAFNHETQKIAIKIKVNNRSELCTNENEDVKQISGSSKIDLNELIIDLSVSKLSICEKMKLEVLCRHFNQSDVKPVQGYFAYHTVAEMKKYFVDLSEYFEVSRDDFICLRRGVLSSYVPKTSLVLRDNKGRFVLNANSNLINYNGPDFVQSGSSLGVSSTSRSSGGIQQTGCRPKKKFISSKKSLTFCAKKPSNAGFVSEEKQNKLKNQALLSDTIQDFMSLSLHEQSGQAHTVSPSCSQPLAVSPCSQQNCLRNVSISSIPGKITVSVQLPCQPAQNTNQVPKQSFADSKVTYPSDNHLVPCNLSKHTAASLVSSGCKQNQVPRQPNKQFPYSTSQVQNLQKLGVPSRSSMKDSDKAVDQMPRQPNKQFPYSNISTTQVQNLQTLDAHCSSIKASDDKAIDQMPPQSTKQFPHSTSQVQNLQKLDVPCNSSLETSDDRAIGSASHPPTFEENYDQGGSKDLDCCESYGLELVNAFLEDCNSVDSSSLAKRDVPEDAYAKEISDSHVPYIHSMSIVNAEIQALNFFSTVVANYDCGISASLLKERLNFASQDVNSFMTKFYGKDFVSFFLRHKKIFNVVPGTDNIVLV